MTGSTSVVRLPGHLSFCICVSRSGGSTVACWMALLCFSRVPAGEPGRGVGAGDQLSEGRRVRQAEVDPGVRHGRDCPGRAGVVFAVWASGVSGGSHGVEQVTWEGLGAPSRPLVEVDGWLVVVAGEAVQDLVRRFDACRSVGQW